MELEVLQPSASMSPFSLLCQHMWDGQYVWDMKSWRDGKLKAKHYLTMNSKAIMTYDAAVTTKLFPGDFSK